MPPQTRASMTSFNASERRLNVLAEQGAGEHLLLVTVNVTLSVPKKSCSACTIAPLPQPWPDGWSGKPGLTSFAPETATVGSNSGVQVGSPWVAALSSLSPSRIA